jgi:hypothetical protein
MRRIYLLPAADNTLKIVMGFSGKLASFSSFETSFFFKHYLDRGCVEKVVRNMLLTGGYYTLIDVWRSLERMDRLASVFHVHSRSLAITTIL